MEGAVVVRRLKLTELTNTRALYFERMAGSRMVERLVSYLLSNNTKFLVSENDIISTHHFRDTIPHNWSFWLKRDLVFRVRIERGKDTNLSWKCCTRVRISN